MDIMCKLVARKFKTEQGEEKLYYRLEYAIDEENFVSVKLSKSDAMLIMLSESR